MTDFIPGEAYRLDVKAADNKIIVDSWQNKLRADVVSDNGVIQVDVSTGKLYGPLVGDIEDVDGNLVFNLSAQVLRGDIEGSVYDATGNQKLVDGMSGKILATVEGNVVDSLGNVIVDTANRTITANTINGDLYGDVYGNISSDSVVYGTFSGDFNGTAYGEFFGDTTGTHTGEVIGDVTGNITGNVTGSVVGELLAMREGSEIEERLTGWNEHFQQWEWYGGVGNPFLGEEHDVARGPIILAGPDRTETALRANVIHYDGTEIIKLHTVLDPTCETAPATIRGHFDGVFIYTDGETAQDALTADLNGTTVHAVNGKVTIGGYVNDYSECDLNILADCITTETNADEDIMVFKKHRGTLTAKTSVAVNDPMLSIHAQGYNGNGYVDAGRFGIVTTGTPDADANYINTEFSVSLPNSSQSSLLSNTNKLTFNNRGVLSVPVFKANGHTFATRDALTAQAGMIVFNTSNNKFQGYTGTAWVDLH